MSKHMDVRGLDVSTPIAFLATVHLLSIQNYVLHWARNPKPGSIFARLTRLTRMLPDAVYLWALRELRYSGLVLVNEGKIVGHAFYQQHGDEVHLFSVEVHPSYRGLGYANRVVEMFLNDMCLRCVDVNWVRISAGGDPAMLHMWHKALLGDYNTPCRLERAWRLGLGWARIVR
jgi:GNAT superfamily N-acetyltransferase